MQACCFETSVPVFMGRTAALASVTAGGGAVGADCWVSDSRLGRETKIGITSGGACATTVTLPPLQSLGLTPVRQSRKVLPELVKLPIRAPIFVSGRLSAPVLSIPFYRLSRNRPAF